MPRLSFSLASPGIPQQEGEVSRPASAASSRSSEEAGDPMSQVKTAPPSSGLGSHRPSVSAPSSPSGRSMSKKGTMPERAMSKTTSITSGPSEKKRSKGTSKKRSTRRTSTVSASPSRTASGLPSDTSQHDEPETGDDTPARQVEKEASESDVDLQGSEHLQEFLKLDRKSTRLETKVREGTEQLSKLRYQLLGENASILDLDRLNCVGDERARAMAQDSVSELRQKWTEMLRRASVDEQPVKEERIVNEERWQTEEDAFQETYAKLMAEIGAPIGPDATEAIEPDADDAAEVCLP